MPDRDASLVEITLDIGKAVATIEMKVQDPLAMGGQLPPGLLRYSHAINIALL